MDLHLFFRVLWRFRAILFAGVLLASVLAVMAPRGSETWRSQSVLLVTQQGFPYGRAVPQYTAPNTKAQVPALPIGDQTRFAQLTAVYSAIANSDRVQANIHRKVRAAGQLKADPLTDANGGAQPMVSLTATSPTRAGASALAVGAAGVVRSYVRAQQEASAIPPAGRVELQVLQTGDHPTLAQAKKSTLAILVFVAVIAAAIALAFILENARPARRSFRHARPLRRSSINISVAEIQAAAAEGVVGSNGGGVDHVLPRETGPPES